MRPTACQLLFAAALLSSPPSLGYAEALGPNEAPDFHEVIAAYDESLGSLTSETDALALFNSTLARPVGLEAVASATSSREPAATALATPAAGLSVELAAWALAISLQQATDLQKPAQVLALAPRLTRQNWLLHERPELAQAAQLATILTQQPLSASGGRETGFTEYASNMDKAYPALAGEQSWMQVALHSGLEGIRQRLGANSEEKAVNLQRDDWIARYFETRIRPVLTAQLAALAIRAEASAEQRVRQYWNQLQDWIERSQQRKRLARLCGTWQWTVHNHQNHQDHKMAISFPPAELLESSHFPGPRPQKVVVLGDSVYLRWELQGGVQEDSLLFTAEGQRLEGSFRNTAGAWGSITGKRIGRCEAQGQR